uniref:Peptidase S1 domain-containing protein n=1 Tax=Mola mola TaxID=94237 RepID=A0A3Q4BE51_MOLML
MSSWQCKKRYGNSFSSHGTVCAGGPPDTSLLHGDSCQGNSGGGLVCQDETGRWVLAGVVAGGHGCGDPSSPSLYTRVGRFRGWIDEVTGARAETPEDPTHFDTGHTHGKLKHAHEQQKHKGPILMASHRKTKFTILMHQLLGDLVQETPPLLPGNPCLV